MIPIIFFNSLYIYIYNVFFFFWWGGGGGGGEGLRVMGNATGCGYSIKQSLFFFFFFFFFGCGQQVVGTR